MTTTLELNDAAKAYRGRPALAGLTFALRAGTANALVGENGAGKSTTFALIAGLLRPDRGSVAVLDKDPRSARVRRAIGYAPQQLAFYPELTALENVAFFAQLYGMGRAERRERAHAALAEVGLAPRASDRASTLSGGMARRLNLACSLVHDPSILLLDEPTTGVDGDARATLLEIVAKRRDRGATVLLTTHRLEEVERLCERVLVLSHGHLVADDSPRALVAQHGGLPRIEMSRAGAPGDEPEVVESADPLRQIATLTGRTQYEKLTIRWPNLERAVARLTQRTSPMHGSASPMPYRTAHDEEPRCPPPSLSR